MDPFSIALVGGGILSGIASIFGGNEEAEAMRQQAQAKRRQAVEIMKSAERDAGLTRKKGASIQASQASGFGRSGVDIGSGTPLAMMAKTLSDAEEEATAIMEAGKYRYDTSMMEASAIEKGASATQTAGYIGAGTSILNTAGRFYSAKGNV